VPAQQPARQVQAPARLVLQVEPQQLLDLQVWA
jgi:hypothetical protein